MYPTSRRDALVAQLEAEAVLYGLTYEAFMYWLPYLTAEAMPGGETFDLSDTARSATAGKWETAMDGLIVYGAGLVYGRSLLRAADAGGVAEHLTPSPDPGRTPVPAAPRTAEVDTELARTARKVVASSTGMSTESVSSLSERLASIPTTRELQSRYMLSVRNRMVDTPDSVFRAIAADIDKGLALGESPSVLADRVQKSLGPQTGDWQGRAMTVARTESAGAQSAATLDAALLRQEVLGEEIESVWTATVDSKTRPEHFAADGQRVKLGSAFDVGGYALRYPGDDQGPPEMVINCRCALFTLGPDEPLPGELDRHTERGPGDATVRNREGSRADEVARRADEGTIRAREDPDGVGRTASAHRTADKEAIMAEQDEATFRTFTDAVVALLGETTDDGRMLAADIDLTFRSFPLPLMWVKQTGMGHENAYTVGVMEAARVEGSSVLASGYLLNTAEADEAAEQIGHGVTGPSVDLGAADWIMTDPSGKEVTEDDYWDAMDRGETFDIVQTITAATLMGATLVSTPAFGNTSLTLNDEPAPRDESVAASIVASGFVEPVHKAGLFTDPGFTGPTPLTIDAQGRISGHLACFGTCHVGITDQCVTVPRSRTDYAHFHTSPPVMLDDGSRLPVGRLTVATGHAGPRMGASAAAEHYDNTGTCFALVRAGEDEHGVWVSGIAAPGVDADTLQAGLAAPLSGDWRTIGGNLELVAALAVNTPGFPIVASGATDEDNLPLALVASLAPTEKSVDAAQSLPSASDIAREVLSQMKADERARAANELVLDVEGVRASRRQDEARDIIASMGGQTNFV